MSGHPFLMRMVNMLVDDYKAYEKVSFRRFQTWLASFHRQWENEGLVGLSGTRTKNHESGALRLLPLLYHVPNKSTTCVIIVHSILTLKNLALKKIYPWEDQQISFCQKKQNS